MRTKKKNIKNKRKTYKKKIDKRKRKRKKKSINKNQKGAGVILPAVGIGLAATAVAAAAYKGFRLISKIKDKSHILRLLNQDYIEYSPKVVVTETKDFINHYLNCVSTLEFFQILLSRPEYLTSKTLRSLIKETTEKEKENKKELDSDYSNEYSEIEKLVSTIQSKNPYDINLQLELRPSVIETNKNENIKELKNYLLLTARIPGSGVDEVVPNKESKLLKITPYLTVSTFKWQDIIYKGIYDEICNRTII